MKILITGGCGFIGCNTAADFLRRGSDVTVLDDLSRPKSDLNLEWLQRQGGTQFVRADIRDRETVAATVQRGKFDVVIHLAAQVAVTTSVTDPTHDFEVNAGGTFNVLEAIRQHSPHSIFIYSSTNKVYGKLTGMPIVEGESRYDLPPGSAGVAENQPLDFYSPYGCSKGAADQYACDYARMYGLRTVTLRQSCIYGPRQFGIEDQGWVAWFIIAHSTRRPITLYGNGKQVRDVLHVQDLVDCYRKCIENIATAAGQCFNIGGGSANNLSLLEFLGQLERYSGRPVQRSFADWRPGDQPLYVSDIAKARKLLAWAPKIDTSAGLAQLWQWVADNPSLFDSSSHP